MSIIVQSLSNMYDFFTLMTCKITQNNCHAILIFQKKCTLKHFLTFDTYPGYYY